MINIYRLKSRSEWELAIMYYLSPFSNWDCVRDIALFISCSVFCNFVQKWRKVLFPADSGNSSSEVHRAEKLLEVKIIKEILLHNDSNHLSPPDHPDHLLPHLDHPSEDGGGVRHHLGPGQESGLSSPTSYARFIHTPTHPLTHTHISYVRFTSICL